MDALISFPSEGGVQVDKGDLHLLCSTEEEAKRAIEMSNHLAYLEQCYKNRQIVLRAKLQEGFDSGESDSALFDIANAVKAEFESRDM